MNLFDSEQREAELKRLGSDAAKADAIASRMKRVISEKMQEDPAFYKKFSRMLQEAIEDWRARRLSDAEYLAKAKDLNDKVVTGRDESLPDKLVRYDVAKAYFGEVREVLQKYQTTSFEPTGESADAAIEIDRIIEQRKCVDWTQNEDVMNRMRTDIEDFLFEMKDKENIPLTLEDIDSILESCVRIALERNR